MESSQILDPKYLKTHRPSDSNMKKHCQEYLHHGGASNLLLISQDTFLLQRIEGEESNIFAWGSNQAGQLSFMACGQDGTSNVVMDPMAIKFSSIKMIKQVACGRAHALIISEHQLVFGIGDNHFG